METVKIEFGGDVARMTWDGSNASSPICVNGKHTGYQTGTARHRTDWAVLLCARQMWPEAEWPSSPNNGNDPIIATEAWDELSYEQESPYNGRVIEQGNGFPSVGDYVPSDDGNLYKVLALGRIQTGNSLEGESNWCPASLEPADWDDCEEEDEFRASAAIDSEDGESEED